MALDPREREQLNRIKKLWRSYGIQLIVIVGSVAISLAGFNIYTGYQNNKLAESAELYEQFKQLDQSWQTLARDNASLAANASEGEYAFSSLEVLTAMEEVAELLRLEYSNTNQAAYANLRLGAIYVHQQDLTTASQTLRWVITNAKSSHAIDLAVLQLSRIIMVQGDPTEALALIESRNDVSATNAELRGDILRALGRYQEALAAYQLAIKRGSSEKFIRYKISLLPLEE